MSSNERVQADKRHLRKTLHHTPANQYKSDSSMTNKVHDTNILLVVFLDLKT